MSDTSARARRFALAFGSFARKGLIGARAAGGVADEGVGATGGRTVGAATWGGAGAAEVTRAGVGGRGTAGAFGAANGAAGAFIPGRDIGAAVEGRAKGAGIPAGA